MRSLQAVRYLSSVANDALGQAILTVQLWNPKLKWKALKWKHAWKDPSRVYAAKREAVLPVWHGPARTVIRPLVLAQLKRNGQHDLLFDLLRNEKTL